MITRHIILVAMFIVGCILGAFAQIVIGQTQLPDVAPAHVIDIDPSPDAPHNVEPFLRPIGPVDGVYKI
jgi:hypothetical protein